MNRRAFAGGLAGALALPTALRAGEPAYDADVAIVGAGAAGIAAARALRALGKSFLIFEARDRVGGRMFTDTSLGAPFDAGAMFIHWAERNPWRDIAASRSVETINSESLHTPSQFFENGQRFERRGRRGAFASLDRLFDTDAGPVPDVSMAQRASAIENEGGAEAIARMALGDEAEHISALDYARLWSGDDLLVPSGYGALAAAMADGLDIRLSTPVTAIDTSGAGVALETSAGRVRTRSAIVTVPVGVLKAGAIRFTPQLPADARAALDGLAMGALSKIGLKFDGARLDIAPGTDLWDRLGPRASFDFECWAWDRDIVVAYFGGDHARDIVGHGERAAINIALDELTRVIGPDVRRHFVKGVMHGWSVEPWSLGCYSHCLPGHADARAKLAVPVAERLWFAGEATGCDVGAALTAGGAWMAGEAAARAAAPV